MSRLLEVADLCSRPLSDPANRLRKTRKKKSSAVPLFSKRSHIGNLRRIRKQGKGRSPKRKGNHRCPFLFAPAAGAATSPPSADGESPAEVQRKTFRPSGANTLTQFAYPAQPVQKRSRPSGANTLTQFEYPAGLVQKRSRPSGANPPAAVRAPRSAGVEKKPPGGQGRKRCRFITIKN